MPLYQQQTPPEIREGLIAFAHQFNPNHFMTPIFNRSDLSVESSKRMLRTYIRRLCEKHFGHFYMQNPMIKRFNGVVFIEKSSVHPHFHIPVHIPAEIESKFKPYAEQLWSNMYKGGNCQIQMIMSDDHLYRAIAYSAKDSLIPTNTENWCTLCMLYGPTAIS
jgi:hypothetical protein